MAAPFTNPLLLNYMMKVRLKDGREGQISDKANHRKSRIIDLESEIDLKVYKITEIAAVFIAGEWVECIWS